MAELDLEALKTRSFDVSADPLGRLTGFVAAIGTIWTFLLMALIVADVVGRSFLSMPITGVAEIAAHSIVAIVFLQLAATVHAGRMTRADFLIERLHRAAPGAARVVEAVFLLFGAAIAGLIAYASFRPTLNAYAAGEFFGVRGVFTISTWPFRAIIVGGAGLAAIVYVARAAHALRPSGEASR
ncbi:MAG: TRAP transporter small permease [Methylobacteriaceae bacterium]|nr:TRAP transporter small permease [Methylobacteriaceae bacterium]